MAATASTIAIASASQNDTSDNKKMLDTILDTKTKQELKKDKKTAKDTKNDHYAPDFFSLLGSDIVNKIGKCQNSADLSQFKKTMRFANDVCRSDMEMRRQVGQRLLPGIFKGKPEKIDEFFARFPNVHPEILLVKSSYRDGHYNKATEQFECFRDWQGVSPLQAAYLSAEGPFQGQKILNLILNDPRIDEKEKEVLLKEIQQQMEELTNRLEKNLKKVNEDATVTTFASNTASTSAATVTTATFSNSIDTKGNKEHVELHQEVSVKTKKEIADRAVFLAPIKELIKAYKEFFKAYREHQEQYSKNKTHPQSEWIKVLDLWAKIGVCQKRLPRYVLQEFFAPISFSPLPEFNIEPPRGECHYSANDPLDLNKLGINWHAFFKGEGQIFNDNWVVLNRGPEAFGAGGAAKDLAAMERLCELREADLENTLLNMNSLESARKFLADKAAPKIKQ